MSSPVPPADGEATGPLPPRIPDYLDFDLQIDQPSGAGYSLRVLASPAGEAHGSMQLPFDQAAVQGQLEAIQDVLTRGLSPAQANSARSAPEAAAPAPVAPPQEAPAAENAAPATPVPAPSGPDDPQGVQAFGQALMQALFTDQLRSAYDASVMQAVQAGKRLRLRLRIEDPVVATLPWEFLFDAQQRDYLVLGRRLSLVRYLEAPYPAAALGITPPLRILALASGPSDLPGLDVPREKERMQAALAGLLQAGLVEVTWLENGSWRELQQALREQIWHVFHFSGHGGFSTRVDEGILAFEDDEGKAKYLSATDVGHLLADHPTMRLAVLNACQGAEGSRTNIHASTAATLVAQGIPAVIAMQYEITDDAAIEFGRSLYEAIADELPVDAAVSEARIGVSIALKQTLEWGTPVLFMRATDSALFRLTAPPQAAPAADDQPLPPCPYRGLFAFREEDAARFFGRDAVTEQLVDAVQRRGLTAVVGPSGSGKSSVVFAGLVPTLRAEGSWQILSFRPSASPLHALASALLPALEPQLSETDRLIELEKLAGALRQGQVSLSSVVQRLLQKSADAQRLLLVVDQFEELYTLCRDDGERDAFISALLALSGGAADGSLTAGAIVLTLRADFYGAALANRALADALQTAGLNLGPMTTAELQEAIARPAQQVGVRFEAGLIDRLLTEIGGAAGELPLLQFALTELWAQQRAGTLTHAAYEAMGGVRRALAGYAETTYTALSPAEQLSAQRIFVQLVQPGDGTADTRRQATRDEIGTQNWDLVVKLADARLLVTGRSETGQDTVEVVHEALIAGWARLQGWINADRGFRLWQERLRDAARQWEASNRDAGALLRGAPLAEAEHWLADRGTDLSPAEQAFIQAGVAERKREQAARERLRWRITMSALAAALALLVVAGIALLKWRDADVQKQAAVIAKATAVVQQQAAATAEATAVAESTRAEQQRAKAVEQSTIAESRQLAAQSRTYTQSQPDLALLLGAEAGKLSNTFESRDGLLQALQSTALLRTVVHGASGTGKVTLSQDGGLMAVTGDDNMIAIRNVSDPAHPQAMGQPFNGVLDAVKTVAFRPDGKLLAVGGSVNTYAEIALWDVSNAANPRLLRQPPAHPSRTVAVADSVQSLAFSQDGRTLIWSSGSGEVVIWNVATPGDPRPLGQLPKQPGFAYVSSLALSQDGTTLVTGGHLLMVTLWDISVPASPKQRGQPLGPFSAEAAAVALSLDGRILAVGSTYGGVLLWDVADIQAQPRMIGQPVPEQSRATSLTFSADSKLLVSGSDGGAIYLWDPSNRQQIRQFGQPLTSHSRVVTSVAFAGVGRLLASRDETGSVALWDLATLDPARAIPSPGPPEQLLKGGPIASTSVALSADGRLLATISAAASDSIVLWDVRDAAPPQLHGQPLSGATGTVASVTFNPNGKALTATMYTSVPALSRQVNFSVWLWDLNDVDHPHQLGQPAVSPPQLLNRDLTRVGFSPNGETLAVRSVDGTLTLWNVADARQPNQLWQHSDVQPAGPQALLQQQTLLFQSDLDQVAALTNVAFSPDGNTLAARNADGELVLWDVTHTDQPRQIGAALRSGSPTIGLGGGIDSVAFSLDGKTLATGTGDDTIILWDLSTPPQPRQLGQPLFGHTAAVASVAFSTDGKTLASVSIDQTFILWDVSTATAPKQLGQPFSGTRGANAKVAFSPDGNALLAAGLGYAVRWDIRLASWQDLACTKAGRNLSDDEWNRFLPNETHVNLCPAFPSR